MGSMLRSDLMTQCDMFLQPESAFMIISNLGDMGCVQFEDLNAGVYAFQRPFVVEICRIAEMERRLRYIVDKMHEDNIYIPKALDDPPALEIHETNIYETIVEKWERILMEMTTNLITLKKTYAELLQIQFMLANLGPMLGNADLRTANLLAIKKALSGAKPMSGHVRDWGLEMGDTGGLLTVITGLVQRRRSYSFMRMVWRLSFGCAFFYKQTDRDGVFKDSMTNADVRKVAFILVVQGEKLNERMHKVCQGFHCDLYPMPATEEDREKSLVAVDSKIYNLSVVLDETKVQRCKAMRIMARAYQTFVLKLRKAKAIYYAMNCFTKDITKNCLIGRCWVPTADLVRVQEMLDDCSAILETPVQSFMSKIITFDTPPTFHRTNKFTYAFQMLISAYGDSTYRELNPGLYTIITFPFLFSLMFGDMGHGLIVLIVALWMLFKEKKFLAQRSDSEIWNILFGGRYVMLLLGLFSVYAGLIYNDIFSKSLTIFSTGWDIKLSMYEISKKPTHLLEPREHFKTYPVGKDPLWEAYVGCDPYKCLAGALKGVPFIGCPYTKYFRQGPPRQTIKFGLSITFMREHCAFHRGIKSIGYHALALNKILFENSLKMKLSIIIGVVHMMFGLTLSFFNDLYFKHHRYLIFLEFIPQMLFLVCIFFWLVVLIIVKWFLYGGAHNLAPVRYSKSALCWTKTKESHIYQGDEFAEMSRSEARGPSQDANPDKQSPSCSPLVLILFIDMVLFSTSKPVSPECDAYMFESQQLIQQILLIIALLCVPIMLFGPPIYAAQTAKRRRIHLLKNKPIEADDPLAYAEWEHEMEHASETFGELMIHQSVETIEYVLSTVSHTASYLRLWALSLAHAQLSEMLWKMIFSKMALQTHSLLGSLKIVVVFIIWAIFTVSILVLMEGLSAFLHTLRLHWVEFMSKFFIGTGIMFKPFSFESLYGDQAKDKPEVCPVFRVFEY